MSDTNSYKTVTLPLGQIILIQTVLNGRYEHLIDKLGDCNNLEVRREMLSEADAIRAALSVLMHDDAKDAARYRWLREEENGLRDDIGAYDLKTVDKLDAAIDAAMLAQANARAAAAAPGVWLLAQDRQQS
jgi:Arc/MetJ-type ribon-helix-helix transcriptional regulator